MLVFDIKVSRPSPPFIKTRTEINKTNKWIGHIPKYAKGLPSEIPSLKIIKKLKYKKKVTRPGKRDIILPCLGADPERHTPRIIKFIIIIGIASAHSNLAFSERSSMLKTFSKVSRFFF